MILFRCSSRRASRFLAIFPLGCLLIAGLGLSTGLAQEAPPEDSLDRDYAAELPRIPPMSPEKALANFVVKPPYTVELAAAEPQVVDPVAIDFDARGRMYVVEMRGYSEDADLNLGRIRLLEDRDGDGRFEHATVFVDGLSWPTAILCYDGGVFVGAAPDIWFFRDTDGDGKADERVRVFTGFSRSNVQGLLNSFRWTLDNRVEAATSSSGATVTCPRHPDRRPLTLRGRDFSFDPWTWELRAESGGAQHGMSFDEWGTKFVCSNSNHLQQVMFEDRYVARNPYLAASSPRAMIAADGPQAEVYRSSPVEPWRIVRTRLRIKKLVPGPVEGGGRASGYFTSATGLTIFLGDGWLEADRGLAIVGDVGSNIVHRKRLQRSPDSLTYLGKRIDEKSEFIASKDIWFRPVQFANGPDGCLYIIDMYRETIEHPASLPPIIKKHLDLTSGRDRGRIYRVARTGAARRPLPRLDEKKTEELVTLLSHSNEWHRATAARLLATQRKPQAAPLLRKTVRESSHPQARIRALYLLVTLEALDADTLLAATEDEHPQVRRHAVRASETLLKREPLLRTRIARLAGDPDVRVRYQVAFTLGELSDEVKTAPLVQLIQQDGTDRWMAVAIRSSLHTGSGRVLAHLVADKAFATSNTGRQWITALAGQIGKQQRSEDVAAVLKILTDRATPSQVAQAIMRGLAPKPNSPLAKQLAAIRGGSAAEATRAIVERARKVAENTELPAKRRAAAVRELALGSFSELRDLFADLLQPSQQAEIQMAALATLGGFTDPEVAELVLENWTGLSPSLRTRAGDLLASRTEWARALVQALADRRIPTGDVSTSQLKRLASLGDAELTRRVGPLLKGGTNADRQAVVKRYAAALRMKGDVTRGREVFRRVCASCHQVDGIGHAIGPNLAAMRNRGAEAILTNVFDPNREVNPEFLNYNVRLTDGRVLSGMIASESANSLVLKRADNASDTVLRIDIDALKSTGQSLMPEGLEKEVTVEQMADLLAFLLADR